MPNRNFSQFNPALHIAKTVVCHLNSMMIKIHLYIIFVILLSCDSNQNTNQNKTDINFIDTLKVDDKYKQQKRNNDYEDITQTLMIGREKYIVTQPDPRSNRKTNLIIINNENDTIYFHEGYGTNGFELEDFDENGISDIRIYQITNVGGISELVMFDKTKSIFKPIKHFDNFPDPTRIENTDLWYSYHGSGCADLNWGSELFKIDNFEAVKIGVIEGYGCEGEKENGIFVFKVIGDNKNQVYYEKRETGFYNDKWDFIEKYWKDNYKKFNE